MNKWNIPVEYDETTEDYFVTFPENLLKKLDWKEGDLLEWIDCKNGSFQLKKIV